MKSNSALRSLLIAFGSASLAASAHAADGTWTATAAGPFNWSDTNNWSGGVADDTDSTAFFTSNIAANQTVTVNTVRTIGNITFTDSTTNSHNLTISGTNMLTLDLTAGASVIDVTQSGRTLTISAPVTINDGLQKNGAGALAFGGPITLAAPQTWTNTSAGALTTGNGTNLITNGSFQFTVDGTGITNFGVINNAAVTISGSGPLVKNGAGRLNIGGINSGFSGTVTVNGGVLQVHNDPGALSTGNVTLNTGVLSFYWGLTYTRTLGPDPSQVRITGGESGFAGAGTTGPSINLGTTVVWGASGEGAATGFFNPGKFVLGDAGTPNAGSTTFASGIDLNGATRTIVVPPGTNAARNRSAISGAISNSSITGTAGLIKEGGGTLTLSNASSAWNGDTTVSAGLLDFAGNTLANISGGSGRDITVASGAAVRFNALTNSLLNRIVETTDEITVMTGTTANSFDFSSSTGANLPAAFLGNWAGNGAKAEYSGTLTPASDHYRLGSPRSSGLLGIRNESPMTGSQGLIIGGGSVELVGAKTFTGDTTVRNGGRLGLAAISGGGGVAYGLQNSALDTGTASDTGTFWFESGAAIGPITGSVATTSAVFGGLKGSRNLSSVYSTTTGANNSGATAVANITGFTLNPGTGVTCSYSGVIANFAAGATITKTGDGTQILSGACTYTGATKITGGTLALGANNVLADASPVILGGGTLDASTYQDAVATLEVTTGASAINLGANAKLAFADSSAIAWTGTLNLTGPFVSGVSLRFGDGTGTGTGLTADQLSRISAAGFGSFAINGTGFLTAAPSGGGYAAWKSANNTSQTMDLDHDGDGVPNGIEYFLRGPINSGDFDILPNMTSDAGGVSITWTKAGTYTGSHGTDFLVETSSTLAAGSWTNETATGNVTITGNSVKYTFPSPLTDRRFVRLKVTGP